MLLLFKRDSINPDQFKGNKNLFLNHFKMFLLVRMRERFTLFDSEVILRSATEQQIRSGLRILQKQVLKRSRQIEGQHALVTQMYIASLQKDR